jgi:hypothetical protein
MEVELWRARNEYLSTLSARVEAQQLIPHSFIPHGVILENRQHSPCRQIVETLDACESSNAQILRRKNVRLFVPELGIGGHHKVGI